MSNNMKTDDTEIKIFFFFISLLVIFCLTIGLFIAGYSYSEDKYSRILSSFCDTYGPMISMEPNVIDVEISYHDRKNRLFDMNIFFDDGGSLRVMAINVNGIGDMVIGVGGCIITVIDRNINFLDRTKNLQMWSIITGEQLESIMDIVRNYHAISLYASDLPFIRDYVSKYGMEERYREAAPPLDGSLTLKRWEVYSEVIKKMLAEDLLPSVMLEQEYFLCITTRFARVRMIMPENRF
jgi:hypothetical protein